MFVHFEQTASEAYGGKEQFPVEHSGMSRDEVVRLFPSSTPLYKALFMDGSTPSTGGMMAECRRAYNS